MPNVHLISFADAAALTHNYRATGATRKGGYFNKEAILALMNQLGCAGMRYYYGLDSTGNKVLILVGVDDRGNDMVGIDNICLERCSPCPDMCGDDSILNSD